MYSWHRKAAAAATLMTLMTMTACTPTPGDRSPAPPSVSAAVPASDSSGATCVPLDRRHAGVVSDYWYWRIARDLEGVTLPQPDCIRSGRHGDVTLIWMTSDPGLLLTFLGTFDLAGWHESSISSDLISFVSPQGTSVTASYVRFGYEDSEEPYVALVYVRGDVPPAPGSPGWDN